MKYIQFLFILNVERMGMIESKKWGRWGSTAKTDLAHQQLANSLDVINSLY